MPSSEITVTAADGGTFDSYFATPEAGAGPGVVIVATVVGVEPGIKDMAGDLARRGFAVSVPDMFWRDHDPGPIELDADGWKRAFARSGRSDIEQGMRDLADVIADLTARPECNGKMAVMGLCFGGPYAFLAAARLGTDAGISFHGSHVGNYLDEADGIRCPMSFHYGDRDQIAPMEEIEAIKAAFDRLDGAELYVYPGAQHGYMLPSRGDIYDEAATTASWERALATLAAM